MLDNKSGQEKGKDMGHIEHTVIAKLNEQIIRGLPETGGIIATPRITANTMVADLPIDSLGLIEFMTAIEDEYDIIISDCESTHANKVGDMIALIEHKVGDTVEMKISVAA